MSDYCLKVFSKSWTAAWIVYFSRPHLDKIWKILVFEKVFFRKERDCSLLYQKLKLVNLTHQIKFKLFLINAQNASFSPLSLTHSPQYHLYNAVLDILSFPRSSKNYYISKIFRDNCFYCHLDRIIQENNGIYI